VIATFGVRELLLFREALIACDDINLSTYLYLSKNKKHGKTSGNVSKITRQSYHRLTVFVARLYRQAHIVINRLDESGCKPVPFSFATYPF
jgi:hypothetical protein